MDGALRTRVPEGDPARRCFNSRCSWIMRELDAEIMLFAARCAADEVFASPAIAIATRTIRPAFAESYRYREAEASGDALLVSGTRSLVNPPDNILTGTSTRSTRGMVVVMSAPTRAAGRRSPAESVRPTVAAVGKVKSKRIVKPEDRTISEPVAGVAEPNQRRRRRCLATCRSHRTSGEYTGNNYHDHRDYRLRGFHCMLRIVG